MKEVKALADAFRGNKVNTIYRIFFSSVIRFLFVESKVEVLIGVLVWMAVSTVKCAKENVNFFLFFDINSGFPFKIRLFRALSG